MKDLGVIRRLEAKSSRRSRWVIKARKVCSDSSNLVFEMVSGQVLGWKAQPAAEMMDQRGTVHISYTGVHNQAQRPAQTLYLILTWQGL